MARSGTDITLRRTEAASFEWRVASAALARLGSGALRCGRAGAAAARMVKKDAARAATRSAFGDAMFIPLLMKSVRPLPIVVISKIITARATLRRTGMNLGLPLKL
jgi:hypothetical protein